MRLQMLLSFLACSLSLQYPSAYGQGLLPSTLGGRVTDSSGKPLSAHLTIYGRTIVDGRIDLFAMCATSTDLEGRYECNRLRQGSYIISATPKAPDAKTESVPGSRTYSRTFFPSGSDLSEASPVTLKSGQSSFADIVVKTAKPGKLHGEVPGHPPAASLQVRSHFGTFDLPVTATPVYDPVSGRFVIDGLPPGDYSVSVDWSASGKVRHGYALVRVVSDGDRKTALQETKQIKVKGVVHSTGDDLSAQRLPTSVTLEGTKDHAGWRLSAPVTAEGSFTFPPIWDGDYLLTTDGGTHYFVSAISRSGKRHNGDLLQLTADAVEVDLDIELGISRALVSGTVGRDQVIENKSGVVLESAADGRVSVAKLSKGGHFEFRNVPPGEYRLFGWTDLSLAEYRNEAALARKLDQSRSVVVDNDSQLANIEVRLIPSGS